MITREDFLEHGFKPICKPFKTDLLIRLSKEEIPQGLRKSTNEYHIQGWTSQYVDGKEICEPYIVNKDVNGERIIYEKDGLRILTEWANGDDRLRHAYMTGCNSEHYWNEYCPLNMDFDGLIASYLNYLQKEKKRCVSEYTKKITKLKKEHEREINDLNKKIGVLKC